MLKIYWHPLSSASNKVLYCANALGLDYEKTLVNLATGEQHDADHLARHPFGKVPVIDDDGFLLFESEAINRYLARREKSALYPSKYRERALVDQWSDFSAIMLQLAMQKLFLQRVLGPMIGEPPNDAVLQQGLTQTAAYLPIYDRHLAENEYMCGAQFTLADITLVAVLDCTEAVAVDLGEFPHLERWRSAQMSQDYYQSVHRYYGEGILDRVQST